MPRMPRYLTIEEGNQVHKMWRGHNHEFNISSNDEKVIYLKILQMELPRTQNVDLHALCLMSNHVHEVYTVHELKSFSKLMQKHHSKYGQFFNQKHKRKGKIAQDRPKVIQVENEEYEMILTFYIHANPIRAGIVRDAKDYIWSTHLYYAYGKKHPWMVLLNFKDPQWYLDLGKTPSERQRRYRILFDRYLKTEGLNKRYFEIYGYGTRRWIDERRQRILKIYKERKSHIEDG